MTVTTSYSLTDMPEFIANGYTQLEQFGGEITRLQNGGFAVVYGNTTPTANKFPIVTFYDANFHRIGDYSTPYTDSSVFMVGDPEIVTLNNGNVAVIWKEGAAGDNKLLGTIFTPTGTHVSGPFQISSSTTFGDPEATAGIGDNWIVATSDGNAISLQTMNESGVKVGTAAVIDTNGNQTDPSLTRLATGQTIVTFTSNSDGTDKIYAAVYGGNGSILNNPFEVASGGNNNQSAVKAFGDNSWAVVYADSGLNGGAGIALRIYTDAVPNGLAIRVDTDLAAIEQQPDITVLDNNFIVVSWTHPYGANDNDIYARVFDKTGAPISFSGTDVLHITASNANDRDASIASFFGGTFGTIWTDSQSDGSGGQLSGKFMEITRTITGDGVANEIHGDSLRDTIYGNGGVDQLIGHGGDDQLFGGAAVDVLRGGIGNDLLDGGTEGDVMYGDNGSDLYRVDDAGDTINEVGSDGSDTVQSTISFSLANNPKVLGAVENVSLLGMANLNATGNALANTLWGNAGANVLDGLTGADTMRGRAGSDLYRVDNAGDIVDEADGGGGGVDTVQSTISFSLANNPKVLGAVENVSLLGTANLNATGNALANTLWGNAGVNILDGLTGADTMRGRGGNDVYRVDNAGDIVDEADGGGGGIDTVQSTITFSLVNSAHVLGAVENLSLTGAGAINATGNALANTIWAGSGNNILTGNGGADTFVFHTALNAVTNVDTITDFAIDDTIQLENAVFTALTTLGTLASGAFFIGAAAHDVDDRIIYNSATGALSYDFNGNLAGGGVKFAQLSTGLALTSSDFFVI